MRTTSRERRARAERIYRERVAQVLRSQVFDAAGRCPELETLLRDAITRGDAATCAALVRLRDALRST